MARVPPRVPDDTDLLCERCGYVLNGLPTEGRCPECGTPIIDSLGNHRAPPAWERPQVNRPRGFLATTAAVLFTPTRFYRTFAVRGSVQAARRFAQIQWALAGFFFAVAATVHGAGFFELFSRLPLPSWRGFTSGSILPAYGKALLLLAGIVVITTVFLYFALDALTRLAARLSTWEASYRGLRLPYPTVLRGMYYHAVHYFPVALIAAATVVGYQVLLALLLVSSTSVTHYLYLLCAEVVLAAIYLFHTYWIGMRNMMYANR